MSGQHPRFSQDPFRDRTDEQSLLRNSSLPSTHYGHRNDVQDPFPSHHSSQTESTGPHLPPISTIVSEQMGGTGLNRDTLPPLRTIPPSSGPRSASASPVSADYDERRHYRYARQHAEDPRLDIRDSTMATSHPLDVEPRQHYQLTPVHGLGVSRIQRPSSALDNAYLSDLSTISVTSSARGAPPPSHTSAESTASASSEMSRTRVRSWQRTQDQGEGQGRVMRDERDSGEAGRFTPTYTEIEYERRHGRSAHFPVSTMRGGSVSSRGHSYSYGAQPTYTSAYTWTGEEQEVGHGFRSRSDSEHEGGLENLASTRQRREWLPGRTSARPFTGSEPVSSATSPIPSDISTHSYGDEHVQGPAPSSVAQRRGHESSYTGWTTRRHPLPEGLGDPRILTAAPGLYASGSPPGGKDISRESERYRFSQPASSISRGAASSTGAQMSGRRSGSPSHASGRIRGGDVLASPRSLPYTSLPRYSTGPSRGPYTHYADADEFRYAKEPPPAPHEGRYSASTATSAPPPQRSYTFPEISDERAQSHRAYPAAASIRDPSHAPLHGPASGLPLQLPPHAHQDLLREQHMHRHAEDLGPLHRSPRFSSSAPVEHREPMAFSLGPTPVSFPTRERNAPREVSSTQAQYAHPQEAPHVPLQAPKPSHPLHASTGSSPKAKRSRSMSLERPDMTSVAATVGAPAAPGVGTGRGGVDRPRGRGRGKRPVIVPSSASDSASRENSQTPVEPPIFWGRPQRVAHAASLRNQPSASSGTLAPAPQRSDEPPIHPDLLKISGDTYSDEPAAGTSSVSQGRGKKGKGKDESSAAGETKSAQASPDVDELQESTDNEGHPSFAVGSSGPSRTGSAGGTRAPRSKIEVACDFCRKRKMKCDGLRPSCKNCQRKGVSCSYIPVVRRRGPGKKQKVVDARPKKSNKRIEAGKKQTKGKGKEKATDEYVEPSQETEAGDLQPEASASGLRFEGAAKHHFPPMLHQAGPSDELYLPSPLQQMQSPRPEGRTSTLSGANISPFPPAALPLPLYPPEQFPPYGHSPPFGGGNLFLPGHSPTMVIREAVDPYASVNVNIPESGGSMLPDVGSHVPIPGSARTASMMSSGRSSSEGELGRQARRRRSSKRAKTDHDDDDMGGHGLEEGEIVEPGPSSGTRR